MQRRRQEYKSAPVTADENHFGERADYTVQESKATPIIRTAVIRPVWYVSLIGGAKTDTAAKQVAPARQAM